MIRHVPPLATSLGVAGLIPFAGAGIAALGIDPSTATRAVLALVAYGAVILAFLGGVHWGFAFDAEQPSSVRRARLCLGVLPSLAGWTAMLIAIAGLPDFALIVLVVAFAATMSVEAQASRRGLMPPGYVWLRGALSAAVVLWLAIVCVIRLLGGHVLL